MDDYDWADLIDQEDKVRMLISPQSEYAQAGAWAMGRAMDDALIAAATGNAFGGVAGGTTVALPATKDCSWQCRANIGKVNFSQRTIGC